MKKHLFFTCMAMALLLASCHGNNEKPEEIMGLKPVYGNWEDLEVQVLPPQEMCTPGKIYVYGPYLFVNELHKGIHIINNSNPERPEKLSFIRVAGNVDMAVRDGFLYADQFSDIVVINITNPQAATFVNKVKNAIEEVNMLYPVQRGVSFECVDPSKGPVIGWAEALLTNPKCFR